MDKDLKKIFLSDQNDRNKFPKSSDGEKLKQWADWIVPRDKKRVEQTMRILHNRKLAAIDYYHAAMVFQHSEDIKTAVSLAKKSMDMGYEKAKWLYAAATDRYLVRQGKKQRYGTQFKLMKDGALVPLPINKRVSDKERELYNVPPVKTKLIELQRGRSIN